MDTTTPTPSRATLPSRPLATCTGKACAYVPAVKTDIRRTFKKFRLLARLQGQAQAQRGAVAESLLDVLTAGVCAAGLVALLLASTDALAGTPEAHANMMPPEFLAAFAIAVLVLVVVCAVLMYALGAANKADADNVARLREAEARLRAYQQAGVSAAQGRADERSWADAQGGAK